MSIELRALSSDSIRTDQALELVVHSQAGDVEIRLRLESSGQRYADARRRHQKIIGVIVEAKVQILAPDRPVVGDRIFQTTADSVAGQSVAGRARDIATDASRIDVRLGVGERDTAGHEWQELA